MYFLWKYMYKAQTKYSIGEKGEEKNNILTDYKR